VISLKKEVRALSKLDKHVNVLKYSDVHSFEDRGELVDYGVMEYCSEGNLKEFLSKGNYGFEQKASLVLGVLDGLKHLHACGIVHRDIKPSNILVSKEEGKYIPKISDFGLSKVSNSEMNSTITDSVTGGTLAYSSPEQLLGKDTDFKTDIWSFGVLAYEVLLSELPFKATINTRHSAAKNQEIYSKIIKGIIPPEIKKLPSNYQYLITGCLKTKSSQRSAVFVSNENLDTKPKEAEMTRRSSLMPIILGLALVVLIVYGSILLTTDFKWATISETWGSNDADDYFKKFDSYEVLGKNLLKVQKNGKWGVTDSKGVLLTPVEYNIIDSFSENFFITIDSLGQKNLFNWKARIIVPHTKYEILGKYEDGLLKVGSSSSTKNRKYGYLDDKGEQAVPLHYDCIASFSEGLAVAVKDSRMGYVDRRGNVVIPFVFKNVGYCSSPSKRLDASFVDDRAMVNKNGWIIQIDKNGNCAAYCPEDDEVLADKTNDDEISQKVDEVLEGNKTYPISKSSRTNETTYDWRSKYDFVSDFKEGRARVKKGSLWGFVDKNGNEVVKIQYTNAYDFSEGLAAVKFFR
jgi:serine/threonine protein kinase